MKDFLQKLKKFLKVAVIVVLVIVASLALYGAYDYQQRQVANTVDQEIAFKCDGEDLEGTLQFILTSTPKSRDTAKFYRNALVAQYEHSEETKTSSAKLITWLIQERSVDFIIMENYLVNSKFSLNRKTFEILIFTRSKVATPYNDPIPAQCEQIEPQEIKDSVKESNEKADALNKI